MEPLTDEQRGCLLRAARRQLLAIEKELTRYRASESRYLCAVVAAVEMEKDNLQAAVSWLWKNP